MARLAAKSKIWVVDEAEAYVAAEVVGPGAGGKIKVKISDTGEEKDVPSDDLEQRADQPSVGEMDDLGLLNMPQVLQNIDMRFGLEQCSRPGEGPATIYSSVGPMLVAMNPFAVLPIYGDEWKKAYSKVGGDMKKSKQLGPHAFKTAQNAYDRLQNAKDVSVVICGESGAGKTYSNKMILEYICAIAGAKGAGAAVSVDSIEKANVLLESFGNAKTTRNHNSSRFGKFSQLMFEESGGEYTICGVKVNHYLLERLRIVSQGSGERNYHIFFQLLRSGTAAQYGVTGGAADYEYTKVGADVDAEVDDGEEFKALMVQMEAVIKSKDERDSILKTMLGVLVLGNIEITGDKDTSSVSASAGSSSALKKASELLGIDSTALSEALTVSYIQEFGKKELLKIKLGKDQAIAQRDTLAKAIYSKVFDGLILSITRCLRARSGRLDKRRSIGLLDIFGFEDMKINGFEQVFINLTNEVIQDLFNNIMFKLETEVYKQEDVNYDFEFPEDRQACLDMFQSPKNGIIKLLAGSVSQKAAGPDGEDLVRVFNRSLSRPKDPSYPYKACGAQEVRKILKEKGLIKPGGRGGFAPGTPTAQNSFIVKHFAGDVLYTVDDWKPKSTDRLLAHLADLANNSTFEFVQELFEGESESSGKTVGEKFREQLKELDRKLQTGDVLFVRCIKSNKELKPGYMSRPMVLEQLRHGGIISALNVRRSGLPDRMVFDDFIEDFRGLEDPIVAKRSDIKERCERLLKPLFIGYEEMTESKKLPAKFHLFPKDQEYAIGKSQVFMKPQCLVYLRTIKNYILAEVFTLWSSGKIITKITGSWETLEQAEAEAKTNGLTSFASVQKALAESRSALTPWYTKLTDMQKAGKSEKDIEEAFKEDTETIRNLRRTAEDSLQVVFRIKSRKDQANQFLQAYLTLMSSRAGKLLEKVRKVDKDCEEFGAQVDPGELQKIQAACAAAKEAVAALQSAMPALKQETPAGVDLEAKGEFQPPAAATICPKAHSMFSKAGELVASAVEAGDAVLIVRRRFLEALAAMETSHQAAKAKLDKLAALTERFSAEGMADVVKSVENALEKESEAQDILEAAKDADGFKAAVAALEAAVAEAEEAVKIGTAELKRREEERRQEEALSSEIKNLHEELEKATAHFESEYNHRPHGFANEDGGTKKEVGEVHRDYDDVDSAIIKLEEELKPGNRLKADKRPVQELQGKYDQVFESFKAAQAKAGKLVAEAEKIGGKRFAAAFNVFEKRERRKFVSQASKEFKKEVKMAVEPAEPPSPVAETPPPAEPEPVSPPAAEPVSPPAGGEGLSVQSWCESIGVPDFAATLMDQGVEEATDLKFLEDDEITELLSSLKLGPRARARKAIAAMKKG
mmetsp:Transcript_119200/g.218389  ORF Transcript_119200/g.218389 Transcript_119200/m.218389 type:complete len:1369 (+) Transcript_119200:50-4156(+)